MTGRYFGRKTVDTRALAEARAALWDSQRLAVNEANGKTNPEYKGNGSNGTGYESVRQQTQKR